MEGDNIIKHLVKYIRDLPSKPYSDKLDNTSINDSQKSPEVYDILMDVMQKQNRPPVPTKEGRPPVVTNHECFGDMYYVLKYPICWFRSFSFILFMDETFRNILIQGLSNHNTSSNTQQNKLHSFILKVAQYVQYGYLKPQPQPQYQLSDKAKLFWLTLYKSGDNITIPGQITMEQVLLYLIQLLNEYDPSVFWCDKILGGFGDVYTAAFFREVWPNITKPEYRQHILRVVPPNKHLIYDIKKDPKNPDPKFILLYFKGPVISFIANNRKTVLFAKHESNGTVYTLSSMIMTTYLTWPTIKALSGHQFGIYKCKRKFYNEDKGVGGYNVIKERQLLAYILLDELLPDNMFYEFKYDLSGSLRMCMYTRSMFIISESECLLLHELSAMLRGPVDKYNIVRIFAILSYFTKSITYEIQKSNKTPGILNLKRFFGKNKVSPAPTKTDLKLWSHINDDNTIGFYAHGTGVSKLQIAPPSPEILDYDILNPPSPEILVNFVNSGISSKDTLTQKLTADLEHLVTFTIKAFSPRNMIQYDLLQTLLRMLNLYVNGPPPSTASGGSIKKLHKAIVMKKTGKQYKVYMDSKGPFIKIKKEPIHLRSLKGKYTYAM